MKSNLNILDYRHKKNSSNRYKEECTFYKEIIFLFYIFTVILDFVNGIMNDIVDQQNAMIDLNFWKRSFNNVLPTG